MDILQQTYLADILHSITQVLLIPTIVLLIASMLYALWCIGCFIVEWRKEHRYFNAEMPVFLEQLDNSSPFEVPQVITNSGLLGKQKRCLLTLWEYRALPVDSHVALAKRELAELEDDHTKKVNRTQTISKIAPMLGLMGTLIPLGPGLIALGVGDTLALSNSLGVAFDTTVAGLVVSLVTYVLTKVRSRWYENYMNALEAATTGLLEKVDALREADELEIG